MNQEEGKRKIMKVFTRDLRNGFIYVYSVGYLRPKAVALSVAWRFFAFHLQVQSTVNVL